MGYVKPAPRRTIAERRADPECRYADEFAAALLMPEAVVRKFVADGLGVVVMSARFGVPAEFVWYRLQMLGLAEETRRV